MIIRTVNLRKYFGNVRAVDGVNLGIKHGEIVAIIGPNGAGKTTLINLISNLIKQDDGKIFFEDEEITELSAYERIKRGIARSFQLPLLFENLTILDNVRLAVLSRLNRTTSFSFIESNLQAKKEVLQILKFFGLSEKADVPTKNLSYGERKLLDVAMAFALNPKVLLLDEPTSGVGKKDKMQIMDIIISNARDAGITIILVEHDMDIVFGYANKVIVLHQGKILAEGKPKEVREDNNVRKVLLGDQSVRA